MDALSLAQALGGIVRARDPNLLVGWETSDDAGVYRIQPALALVQTVDFFPPVVDDPFDYGSIAAANALSDVYAMGGKPLTALNIVAFPKEGLGVEVLREILRGGAEKLKEAGVALMGGHSVVDAEVKYGLAVTGIIDPERIVRNVGARPGDVLLLTKPLGVGIITTAIKRGKAAPDAIRKATTAMAHLNRRASEIMLRHDVHACTDITGYGFLGHALEMARASGVMLEFDHDAIPHFSEALAYCAEGIKPSGLENNRQAFSPFMRMENSVPTVWSDLLYDPQTSGGLLIALPGARALLRELEGENENAAIIGRVVPSAKDEAVLISVV
jgi:selenide,water dikinase